jgi:hypothetical protein
LRTGERYRRQRQRRRQEPVPVAPQIDARELTLSKETLRNLSFSELKQAAGEGVFSDICGDPNTFKQVSLIRRAGPSGLCTPTTAPVQHVAIGRAFKAVPSVLDGRQILGQGGRPLVLATSAGSPVPLSFRRISAGS